MQRFAVLEHDSPRGLHWDLLLETGATLRTWALAAPPDHPGPITADELPDHRPVYLDYEGPVSGNRGSVRRWDHGTYEVQEQSDVRWVVKLLGGKLNGLVTIEKVADQPGKWEFVFTPSGEG